MVFFWCLKREKCSDPVDKVCNGFVAFSAAHVDLLSSGNLWSLGGVDVGFW